MIAEEIEGFSALWVGISGTAGTEGVTSNGKKDEGCLPKGSGESGITGDSRFRGGWRGGYKLSSSLGVGRGFSEMSDGDPFLPSDGFCSCMATPSEARWEFRMSDINVE